MPDNPKSLQALNNRLKTSTAARASFLASFLDTLQKNGVDITDEKVLSELKLNFDLTNGPNFIKGLNASTVVVTLVM